MHEWGWMRLDYHSRIVEMDVEGPLPPGKKSGMVGTAVAVVGPTLVGSIPKIVCAMVMVPLEGIPMMMGGKDVGPPPTIPS